MGKAEQLGEVLAKLSATEAIALARAVEIARLKGKESLPTDLVLSALRARLREMRAPRVPTLRRLVCSAFEYYLWDAVEEPRPPGRIARSTIAPWWVAVQRIAGPALPALGGQLITSFADGETAIPDSFAGTAWSAAAGWSKALLEELTKPQPDPTLRELFPRPGMIVDITTMAALLALAEPLRAAYSAIDALLNASEKLDGAQIIELTPEAVTAAKQHYLALTEAHGMDGRLLALGLMNRLRRPWHILRLARALSWKQNDSLLRETEFGAVGERLILGLSRAARDIAALAGARAGAIEVARIAAGILDYMEESEGLLGEFGFRRDSEWGEAILQTRVTVSNAVGRDFLGRVAEQMLSRIVPVERRAGNQRSSTELDLREAPSEAFVEDAVEAARLFILLLHRGARHGFGQPARDTIDMLSVEFEKRTSDLLDALRRSPGHPVIEAQITAAAQVLDILFDDSRGSTVARRMRLTRPAQATA